MAVVLGPILQFRGVQNNRWSVSALVVCDVDAVPALTATLTGAGKKIAAIPVNNPRFFVFRFDVSAPLGSGMNSISIDGKTASFQVPAANEAPRSAYVSCNGFSDPKLIKNTKDRNERWKHLQKQQAGAPYHLLLMGGDQIYTDGIWDEISALREWAGLPLEKRTKKPWTAALQKDVDKFFCDLYLNRWAQAEFAAATASIPSVMMWDDHDIMDGWGSYPEALHTSPVFQGIFAIARNYFRTLQLQLGEQETHPLAIPGQPAFNLGCNLGGGLVLLVLDLRSERQPLLHTAQGFTPDQVMAQSSADAVYRWLDNIKGHRHLLVMSSIPVCYLDLSYLEKLLGALPGQQELEDDLRDHWRSPSHRGERLRLIQRLLAHASNAKTRVTLLSGDVHVGALAVLESERSEHIGNAAVINQLISSGVVHPVPPSLALFALEHIGNRDDQVDRGIVVRMQPIAKKGGYLISQRNWLALEPDPQGRLWANWHLEGELVPVTKVIHPVAV